MTNMLLTEISYPSESQFNSIIQFKGSKISASDKTV